jgi:vitamin B12 transporter
MRKIIILLLITGTSMVVRAQTRISGLVKDPKGVLIPHASISIKDSYDGATSDSSGKFSFSTTDKGNRILVVTAVGYKGVEQAINLEGVALSLDIVMKEEINEMKAVVITAGTFEASDKKRATVLNSIDIVTTASANADVTQAIKTLPGSQQVGESEGLFVRGGTSGETKTFVDGTLVNNFFYSSIPNISQRSRFSPFIFKGTVFSAGGYSALYGQALSSALILESIDLPERSSASLGVSFLNLSGGFQGLSKNKKASWGMGYGYTNLFLAFKLIKQRQDFFTIPQYHEADANFRIRTSKTGMLKYFGYFSSNGLGFTEPSIDTPAFRDGFKLKNLNTYHNLSWKETLSNGWRVFTGMSFTFNKDLIHGGLRNNQEEEVVVNGMEFKNFQLDTKGHFFNAKAVIEKRLQGLSAIRFGSEYNYSNDGVDFTLYNGEKYPNRVQEHLNSLFAEADIYLTNDVAAKIGSRLEHSALLKRYNFAPRVSLAYKLGAESQASLAYGIFYQTPERRYLPGATDLNFTKAVHYIAQYQKVSAQQTFRAEVFYKKYEDLIKTGIINGREVAKGNDGYGDAKGFEFFWRDRKTIKNFDYWISYSFLDTKRDHLNYPFAIQPAYAARHTGSLVMKKFITKLKTQFNASYTYASARPYYNIRLNQADNQYKIFDQGKTIPYNSVSISVNYLPNVFKQGAGKFTVFVFSINNVFNSKQIYGYKYSGNGIRKEAIVPPSRMFVFLGAFFSFGVDRSQEAVDKNLSIRI